MLPSRRGSNPQPPDHQSDTHPTQPSRPAQQHMFSSRNKKKKGKDDPISRTRDAWMRPFFTSGLYFKQVNLIVPMKFRVSRPFCSREVVENRFSRWQPWWPSWIFYRNYFSYSWSPSPRYVLLSFWSTGLSVKKQHFKLALQDGCHRTILVFFLPNNAPLYFLLSFESIGLSVQEKNRIFFFSKWRP